MFRLKSHIKRFFVIDFAFATVYISNKPGDTENLKKIPFRNIISAEQCYGDTFILKTKDRDFDLMCDKEFDRDMWLAGFNYLIKSTVEVQKIIERNDRESKMKEQK